MKLLIEVCLLLAFVAVPVIMGPGMRLATSDVCGLGMTLDVANASCPHGFYQIGVTCFNNKQYRCLSKNIDECVRYDTKHRWPKCHDDVHRNRPAREQNINLPDVLKGKRAQERIFYQQFDEEQARSKKFYDFEGQGLNSLDYPDNEVESEEIFF